MSENKMGLDDYVRWFGTRKPVAFAWYGLAILEVAAAIFIITKAYILYDTKIDDSLNARDIIELVREK